MSGNSSKINFGLPGTLSSESGHSFSLPLLIASSLNVSVGVSVTGTTVQQINELLRDAYTEEGCRIWWRSPNRNLAGEAPAWLYLFGTEEEAAQVLAEAERLAGGAW